MKKISLSLSVLALAIGLSTLPAAQANVPVSNISATQTQSSSIPSLAPMLDHVLPAVVSVNVEGTETQPSVFPDEFQYFFGKDFPGNRQITRPFQGLGSGVIIDAKNGYIITNNHVIAKADKIKVNLNDGRQFDAKLIGRDAQSDIALLQIKGATNLSELSLADSDTLRVGDYAVAVGNPFGLGQTATLGIVSALSRSGLSMGGLENFIQTDAAINRGNSGGALVNLKGQLIGINTAIIAPGGGNIGIGFAIPSNMVNDLTAQLIKFGEVKRGVLGIKGQEMDSGIADAFKLNTLKGAFVSEVLPKSSAEAAGIKSGDVITSIDGKTINSFGELRAKIATMGADKKVNIGLIRDGKAINVTAVLQNAHDNKIDAKTINAAFDGAELTNNTGADKGVKVDNIAKNSPAESIGLQKGDIIIGVNKTNINNIADLRTIIESKPSVIALNILRGNNQIYLILR